MPPSYTTEIPDVNQPGADWQSIIGVSGNELHYGDDGSDSPSFASKNFGA